MKHTLIEPVAFLVARSSRLYMERHGMTVDTFLAIDEEKDILGFIKAGYEALHLTGDEGVLDEIDSLCSLNVQHTIK
ncbi:MAG: DUF3791 domain-containing protein [Defluviitaleaceae bacterium]|nr:DUF3791 domain-containing protein [Defluviitaleaceae bacterium]